MDRIVFIGNDKANEKGPPHHYVSDKHKNVQISDSKNQLTPFRRENPPLRKGRILNANSFTPLKIYNGTPEGVPLEIQWQQFPINELNGTLLCPPEAGLPKGACPISNLHRCNTLVKNESKWF